MRILVAEDDVRLLKSLVYILQQQNFSVEGVSNGLDALEHGQTGEYDGLVLDIMMPGLDGLEVLRRLRAMGVSTPALFLTARTEVSQRVEGLDAGADDYLSKPFSTEELLARVRAMLRRRDAFQTDELHFGNLTLDRNTYELCCGGKVVALSGKEFQVMEMLLQAPKCVVSTDRLLTHIWGWEADVDSSVIWVHISNLRKKLDAISAKVRIRFVRGAGYVMEETA